MVTNYSREVLLGSVVEIARKAGAAIQQIYESGEFQISHKIDHTPVTRADTMANDIIVPALQALTPTVPIISEESLDIVPEDRTDYSDIWLVDPLDGTKEFMKKSDFFTVNIGLIHKGEPVLGVVYAPAYGVMYSGAKGVGAWRQNDGVAREAIRTAHHEPPIVVVSQSHQNVATKKLLAGLETHRKVALGSSLKLCYVADGTADCYPRLSPSMEWDTAAADAIVRAAGGKTVDYTSRQALKYNKADLHNPSFIAQTKGTKLEIR